MRLLFNGASDSLGREIIMKVWHTWEVAGDQSSSLRWLSPSDWEPLKSNHINHSAANKQAVRFFYFFLLGDDVKPWLSCSPFFTFIFWGFFFHHSECGQAAPICKDVSRISAFLIYSGALISGKTFACPGYRLRRRDLIWSQSLKWEWSDGGEIGAELSITTSQPILMN